MDTIKKWVLTISTNNEEDGFRIKPLEVEYLEGTKEQLIDYMKEKCFSIAGKYNLSRGCSIDFGDTEDTEDDYSCFINIFLNYRIELYAQVENKYLSLENRKVSFSNYKDSSHLASKEVKTVILKRTLNECGLTDEKDVDEILNRGDLPQMLHILFLGGCFVLYDDLEGCGYANKLLNHSDFEESNEEYANKLCEGYSSLKEVRLHYDDLKKFCIQLSSGKILQAIF